MQVIRPSDMLGEAGSPMMLCKAREENVGTRLRDRKLEDEQNFLKVQMHNFHHNLMKEN